MWSFACTSQVELLTCTTESWCRRKRWVSESIDSMPGHHSISHREAAFWMMITTLSARFAIVLGAKQNEGPELQELGAKAVEMDVTADHDVALRIETRRTHLVALMCSIVDLSKERPI